MENYQCKMKDGLHLTKDSLDKHCPMYHAVVRLLEKETDDTPCVLPRTVPEVAQEREEYCQVATDSAFAHIIYDGPTKTMRTSVPCGQQLWVRHYSRIGGTATPTGGLTYGK